MKRTLLLASVLVAALAGTLWATGAQETPTPGAAAEKIDIVYWQYFYETKKNLVDELIKQFEAENAGIKVTHQTFPYENYNTKVAASVPAGEGPNVVNLYYGWLPLYLDAGYLQPLPEKSFNPAQIEKDFFPLAGSAKQQGKYYALPTAVRSLALFWNEDLFKEAGLSPASPPKTNEELVDYARRLTKRDSGGNLLQEGMTLELRGQLHHWVREILIRQLGGQPYSDDNRRVTYNGQAGYDALTFYTDLALKHRVGEPNFMTDDVTAFKGGKAAITIDGSFRLGTLDAVGTLKYLVGELPSGNGIRSNFASYWANGITAFTKDRALEASAKFLQHLTSDAALRQWLVKVGELPAKPSIAFIPENINHAKYGPFIKGLEYAHSTYFVDEISQRQVWIDAYDQVVLKGLTVKQAVDEAAAKEQAVLDKYYSKK
jgi:multiple sugar transport system substrate-binding protein